MRAKVLKLYKIIRLRARRWLLRTLQPCQHMVPLMSESMDRRLDLSERVKLKLHLSVCAWCALYLKQINSLRGLMRSQSSTDFNAAELAISLSPEARQRIAKALER